MCIHPHKFHTAIKQISRLQKRAYLLKFNLFEKRLKP